MKVAILRNEDPNSSKKWSISCEKFKIAYDIIDLSSKDWLKKIKECEYDFFLLKPPGILSHYKTLYDERLYIISKVLRYITFPSYEECLIYENKKFLSYYLKARDIPHPQTNVFYKKEEALEFINSSSYPIISKTSIGASGSGVQVLNSRGISRKYIDRAFSGRGIKRRFGPNRVIGTPAKWIRKALNSPDYLKNKVMEYLGIYSHGERDFVIFQEYIPHDFEWRAVRIGESYFVHKKIKYKNKASGSKGIEYVDPPESILNFTRDLCEKCNFNFMAVDLFEDKSGGYLVNELQTIFGHVQDYIMTVNNIPGRYIYKNDKWTFEPGDFNTNESYDLRLMAAIELYEQTRNDFNIGTF